MKPSRFGRTVVGGVVNCLGDPVHGVGLQGGDDMGVGIEGDADVRVAELFGDDLGIDPGFERDGRKSVT